MLLIVRMISLSPERKHLCYASERDVLILLSKEKCVKRSDMT